MSDDYQNGHKYPRLESAIGVDKGRHPSEPQACCARMPDGRFCDRIDKHPGEHTSTALIHYDHPRPEIDHRIKVHARAPEPPKAPSTPTSTEVAWPSPGTWFIDAHGRSLMITAIDPESRIERHIIGTLSDGSAYACSRIVFDATWKPAPR